MFHKYLIVLFTLFLSVTASQLRNWTNDDDLKPMAELMEQNLPPGVKCNMSGCSVPCPGASPPPFCPKNLDCPMTGCACIFICPKSWVCYETRHCKDFRRYLTKLPFIPRITQENFNYYPF